jgi:hypothetical protein
MDAVRCFIQKSQNQWDLYIRQITGALRALVNTSTGFTLNKLMFGRETNTPATLMFPLVGREHKDVQAEGYVKEFREEIGRAHNKARQNLNTSLKRMKRSYDLRILAGSYDKGDPVYVLDTATVKGICKKYLLCGRDRVL